MHAIVDTLFQERVKRMEIPDKMDESTRPYFMEAELDTAAKSMKYKKALGSDSTLAEVLKIVLNMCIRVS